MGGKSSAGDIRFIVLAWRQARRARACEIKSELKTVVSYANSVRPRRSLVRRIFQARVRARENPRLF